jgi:hypothetical protein
MGALMLKCPATGREFAIGIEMEEERFRKLPDTVTKSRCPYCGLEHRWWTREARLAEPPKLRAEAVD